MNITLTHVLSLVQKKWLNRCRWKKSIYSNTFHCLPLTWPLLCRYQRAQAFVNEFMWFFAITQLNCFDWRPEVANGNAALAPVHISETGFTVPHMHLRLYGLRIINTWRVWTTTPNNITYGDNKLVLSPFYLYLKDRCLHSIASLREKILKFRRRKKWIKKIV